MVDFKITRGEITILAKRICKLNRELTAVCMAAEELTKNEDLRYLLQNQQSPEWQLLKMKVEKFSDGDWAVDVTSHEGELEEVTKILFALFEN